MVPPLERKDVAVDPSADRVVRRRLVLRQQLLDIRRDLDVGLQYVGEVECPALALVRSASLVCRKIDEILRGSVADIEICTLLLVGRLQTGDAEEVDVPPRNDGSSAALNQRFVLGVEALDGDGAEVEVVAPMVEPGPEAEVALKEGHEAGKKKKSVWRKMMGLKPEAVQEVEEEIAGRKAKSALKMGEEDNELTAARRR